MLELLIGLAVLVIVVTLVYWLMQQLPLSEPLGKIVNIVLVVVVAIVIIMLLLNISGTGLLRLR